MHGKSIREQLEVVHGKTSRTLNATRRESLGLGGERTEGAEVFRGEGRSGQHPISLTGPPASQIGR